MKRKRKIISSNRHCYCCMMWAGQLLFSQLAKSCELLISKVVRVVVFGGLNYFRCVGVSVFSFQKLKPKVKKLSRKTINKNAEHGWHLEFWKMRHTCWSPPCDLFHRQLSTTTNLANERNDSSREPKKKERGKGKNLKDLWLCSVQLLKWVWCICCCLSWSWKGKEKRGRGRG